MSHVGMLRWSAPHNGYDDLDLRAIGDPTIPSGIPGGGDLLALVDACLATDDPDGDFATAHARIRTELGDAALVDAAAVFGNFQMMNRIAEGTGIPIARQVVEREVDTIRAIGLDRMLKSQHG